MTVLPTVSYRTRIATTGTAEFRMALDSNKWEGKARHHIYISFSNDENLDRLAMIWNTVRVVDIEFDGNDELFSILLMPGGENDYLYKLKNRRRYAAIPCDGIGVPDLEAHADWAPLKTKKEEGPGGIVGIRVYFLRTKWKSYFARRPR